MKVLFYLSHPSHYYVHKNTIKGLIRDNHTVHILIRKKDILEELLIAEGIGFKVIQGSKKKKGTVSLMADLIIREIKMALFLIRNKADLLVGSDASLAHLSKLFFIPSLIFAEDDVNIIPGFARLTYPFATSIISPEVCDAGRWAKKKTGYRGFQKLAYLHPKYFTPDEKILTEHGLDPRSNFFIIRLAGLSAHHDKEIKGLTPDILQSIIRILKPHGRVLISAENKISDELSDYKYNFPFELIHHFMYYSTMVICDSQSMAVEASMLGVPSIRYNDFVGRISVLEELEHKYALTCGIKPPESEKLYDKILELISQPDLRAAHQVLRQKMLKEKIDVTSFFIWLIETYPESLKIMKENPECQLKFT